MRMALAPIADDRDFSALDEIGVGIGIVIDAHGVMFPRCLHGLAPLRISFDQYRSMRGRRSGQKIPAQRPHIEFGPRDMAATPVRDTSTRPIGRMRSMNWSILPTAPVSSNTKLSIQASITRARKASASRKASSRSVPLPTTLII